MHRPLLALAALGGLAAAAPVASHAQAPRLAVDRLCYPERAPMTIAGTGWVPGTRFTVETDQLFAFGSADIAGSWATATERAPTIVSRTLRPQDFTLTATQNGIPIYALPFQVVNRGVSLSPSRARPTSKVTWRTAGWPEGRSVYVHVRRSGKTIGTAKLGRAKGACGTLSTRKRFMPVRRGRVRSGVYTYQIDLRSRYRSTTTPKVRGTVLISRR